MSLKANVVANYLGQGWTALMGIAFVPLYVHVLGIETYGLIGVFAVLQAWMALFDLGLTPTLNREMARVRAGAHTPDSIRSLLRALESIYAVLAILLIVVVYASAPWLANGWLKAEHLDPMLVVRSIRLMGFVLAARWLEQVYRGALQGMQDQIWLNAVQAGLATFRWGGAYVVITTVSPTIIAFFLWQGAASVLTSILLVYRTYRLLPVAQGATRFSLAPLREVRDFAGGMFLTSVLGLLLTQMDKIVISKLLPLSQFSLYTLASVPASGLLQLITPMNTAIYPRLTEQVARLDGDALIRTYHLSCEWMAAIIIPPGLLLSFFATPMMILWTGDRSLTTSVAPLLAVLALGTLCNGLVNLPYMLQLAHGWTSLSLRVNIAAVLIIIPAVIWVVPRFGAIGAAYAWFALNAGYLVITAHFMHRRLLPLNKWRWYRDAVILPLAAGSITAAVLRFVIPMPTSRAQSAVYLAAVGGALFMAVVAALPNVRRSAVAMVRPFLPFGVS
jgi:O-antigen/teichoic acid export membrane protein